MSEEPAKASSGPGWLKSRIGTAVTTGVAVAIVFALVIVVLISPSISPLASVRDADGDGYPDPVDDFPDDGSEWSDLDGDGVGDNSDAFASDADETTDSDSDGVGDNSDAFPDDSSEWSDLDGDGVGDNADEFASDADETTDSDSDGVGDNSDAFPDDSSEWIDSDGDGVGDNTDMYPEDPERVSPEVDFLVVVLSGVITVGFEAVVPAFPWDHFMLTLTCGTDTAVWEPESADLDGWESMTYHEYETVDVAGTGISLRVGDLTGDGLVSAFDNFALFPEVAFEGGVEYSLSMSYEPTGEVMGEQTICPTETTPTATLMWNPVTDGVKITFVVITDEVEWGDVTFVLTNGLFADEVTNLTTDDLADGVGVTWYAGPQLSLDDLDVTMVVVDLAGNGIVNGGDYIKLTASSFMPTLYALRIIYEPTGSEIAECIFSG